MNQPCKLLLKVTMSCEDTVLPIVIESISILALELAPGQDLIDLFRNAASVAFA